MSELQTNKRVTNKQAHKNNIYTFTFTDFEAATWLSLRVVLPNVELKGCLFHFTQAVFRKIQALGLQRAYNVDAGTLALCKNFMALPLLPRTLTYSYSILVSFL